MSSFNGAYSLSYLYAHVSVSASLLTNIDILNHFIDIVEENSISDNGALNAFKVVFAVIHKDKAKNAYNMFSLFTMVNLVQIANQLNRMQIPSSLKKIMSFS
ncbi:TIGR04141 family sporadically distributed protein [Alkalibacterium psychrotolerans]